MPPDGLLSFRRKQASKMPVFSENATRAAPEVEGMWSLPGSARSERPLMTESGSDIFREDLLHALEAIASSAMTADAALRVVGFLMSEAPAASRQKIDQLKIMDKLLNTSRALMETRIKTGEAESLSSRLGQMERELAELASNRKARKKTSRVAEFFSFF